MATRFPTYNMLNFARLLHVYFSGYKQSAICPTASIAKIKFVQNLSVGLNAGGNSGNPFKFTRAIRTFSRSAYREDEALLASDRVVPDSAGHVGRVLHSVI